MNINGEFKSAVKTDDGNVDITFRVSEYWSKVRTSELLPVAYKLQVNEIKSARSIEQNRLLWGLIDSIASKTGNDSETIYEEALIRCGEKYEYVYVSEAVKIHDLEKVFRVVRYKNTIEHVNSDGSKGKMVCYKVFSGSSTFTVKEMAKLLDVVQSMASEIGI